MQQVLAAEPSDSHFLSELRRKTLEMPKESRTELFNSMLQSIKKQALTVPASKPRKSVTPEDSAEISMKPFSDAPPSPQRGAARPKAVRGPAIPFNSHNNIDSLRDRLLLPLQPSASDKKQDLIISDTTGFSQLSPRKEADATALERKRVRTEQLKQMLQAQLELATSNNSVVSPLQMSTSQAQSLELQKQVRELEERQAKIQKEESPQDHEPAQETPRVSTADETPISAASAPSSVIHMSTHNPPPVQMRNARRIVQPIVKKPSSAHLAQTSVRSPFTDPRSRKRNISNARPQVDYINLFGNF